LGGQDLVPDAEYLDPLLWRRTLVPILKDPHQVRHGEALESRLLTRARRARSENANHKKLRENYARTHNRLPMTNLMDDLRLLTR